MESDENVEQIWQKFEPRQSRLERNLEIVETSFLGGAGAALGAALVGLIVAVAQAYFSGSSGGQDGNDKR